MIPLSFPLQSRVICKTLSTKLIMPLSHDRLLILPNIKQYQGTQTLYHFIDFPKQWFDSQTEVQNTPHPTLPH